MAWDCALPGVEMDGAAGGGSGGRRGLRRRRRLRGESSRGREGASDRSTSSSETQPSSVYTFLDLRISFDVVALRSLFLISSDEKKTNGDLAPFPRRGDPIRLKACTARGKEGGGGVQQSDNK